MTSFIGNSKELYWFFEKALDKKLCEKIIKLGKSKKSKKGVVGGTQGQKNSQKNLSLRNSGVRFFKEQWLWDIIRTYVNTANINSGWNFDLTQIEPVQFTSYKKTNHYGWHQDCWPTADEQGKNRKLSCVIQLSDPKKYEGGNFEFYHWATALRKETLVKQKEQGTVIVFPSYNFHRVTPVTKGSRHSLVSWVKGPKFK
jgi:PKHD-type hydroxylase